MAASGNANLGSMVAHPAQPDKLHSQKQRPMFEGGSTIDDEEEEDEVQSVRPPPLPIVPDRAGPPTIGLGVLLDFAVQQLYHEVTVLAELLPKKQDGDKKVTLVQFAHSTRLLFVKLLAVVKWLKSSKKFDACTSICYLLDQQAQFFVDTADRLLALSREELVFARLPQFQVSAAVDVLATGTFPRLPECIKKSFIPESKHKPRELALTLNRLNRVLEYRISRVANSLSQRFTKIFIRNGMATLTVAGEYEVVLTVLGEHSALPWTLLNISFLVQDHDIGLEKKPELQPLVDMHDYLHSMSQMLQLDVLHCQATQLVAGKLRNKMSIEKYDMKGRVLCIGYWLQFCPGRKAIGQQNKYQPTYRLLIYGDTEDSSAALRVRHLPAGPDLVELDLRSGRVSLMDMLSISLSHRCKARLLRVRKRIEAANQSAHIELCGDRAEVRELESALYGSTATSASIRAMIYRLKVLLVIERYRRAVESLNVRVMTESQMTPIHQKLPILSNDRICLQFTKEEGHYLIITFTADEELVIKTRLYLLETLPNMSITELVNEETCLTPQMQKYVQKSSNPETAKYQQSHKRRFFRSWERPLTSAVAGVEDRISFNRMCEELKKRNIQFLPVRTEPIVGGLILHITDVSGAIDVDCRAFFEALARCCIRQDSKTRMCWPFECCLVNSPIVADFLPNKKGSRVVDRLVVFCHIYDLIYRFAQLYQQQFANHCNILHFTYHKLILAYGEKRDQLLIVNYKNKTTHGAKLFLSFGQCLPQDSFNMTRDVGADVLQTQWNPHAIMAHLLSERLNQEWDLVELVHYLINTVDPLSALAHFFRFRFESVKVYAQMMQINMTYPLQFKCILIPVSDVIIRLVYAHIHLEFHFLEHKRVMVRDVSRNGPKAVGLLHFYLLHSKGNVDIVEPPSVGGPFAMAGTPMEGSAQAGLAPGQSPQGGPASYPSRLELPHGTSPSSVHRLSRSVPSAGGSAPSPVVGGAAHPSANAPTSLNVPQMGGASFTAGGMGVARDVDSASLPASTTPIFIDHDTHRAVCTFVDSAGESLGSIRAAPLDDYLRALVFLRRLGNGLEAYRLQPLPTNLPTPYIILSEYSYSMESVRVTIGSVNIKLEKADVPFSPSTIKFNFHLDPDTMKLKATIKYLGEHVPCEADVAILERYFERCVAHLNNHMAVIGFLNLCRLTPYNCISHFAQIMHSQMEPSPHSFYTVSLSLSTLTKDSSATSNQSSSSSYSRRFAPGVILDQSNNAVMFNICFRPNRPKDRLTDKHLFTMIYHIQYNTMKQKTSQPPSSAANQVGYDRSRETWRKGFRVMTRNWVFSRSQSLAEEEMTAMLALCSQEAARTGECPVWPAVSKMLDNKISQSCMSAMPASVGMPLSVPPGSIANPASNASQRQ